MTVRAQPQHQQSLGSADTRATATQMTMQVPDAVVPIILGKVCSHA